METVIYIFCAYLPIHLIAYLPFFDLSRFGKRWMAGAVAANLLIHISSVIWVIVNGRPDLVAAVGIAMVPVSLTLFFLNIKLSPGKLLFTYVLLVNYQNIVLGISAFLAVRLLHASPNGWKSGVLILVLFGIACVPMYRLFRYAARQIYRIDAPRLWRVIWLIPATMSATVTIFTGKLTDELAGSWQFLLARTSLLLCVVVVYWVLLNALDGIQQQAALQEQLRFEARLLEIQISEHKKYSQLMMEHMTELRRQRHDLRHQMTVIRGLAREDNKQLTTYIDSLMDVIPSAPQVYCENQAVNAIVSYYASLCADHGVETDIRLSVPARTEQIADAELCVIFGNLLENALEACGRMTKGVKFLRLSSTIHLNILTVTMDNSFDGQTHQENGRYRSSKRDAFGTGLSSIQTVARRRGGNTRFEPDEHIFHSSVYVKV